MLDFRTFGQLLVLSMAPDYPELERAKSQLFRWVLIVTRDIKELDIYVYISCTAYTRIPNIPQPQRTRHYALPDWHHDTNALRDTVRSLTVMRFAMTLTSHRCPLSHTQETVMSSCPMRSPLWAQLSLSCSR